MSNAKKKTRLKLNELDVSSFSTELGERMIDLKGGGFNSIGQTDFPFCVLT